MAEQTPNFVEGFAMPTYEQWVAEVEKALKGAPFDKRMYTKTYEGATLRPLYTRQDWPQQGDPSGFAGWPPYTRGATAAGNRVDGWDIRQGYRNADPAAANALILKELARGVTSIEVVFDAAARAGLDADDGAAADLVGHDGAMVYTVDDLDRMLDGVQLELAPVALKAGAAFLPAAGLLSALWMRRGVSPTAALGAFNADPLGALAESGGLTTSVGKALSQLGALAGYAARTYPHVKSVAVDTSPYHDAGATETQDLAISMATGLAYLRAMTEAGLSIDDACRQILFVYAVPADQFLAIAKLRAARKMWARVTEACGASEPARTMTQHAVTAMRMMSKRDPWVNMLRATVAGFAAAVGGAQSITIRPFDEAIGVAGELGRRVARNTHVILAEETNLAKVIDPAGGSWYVESRTDEIAKLAWAEFQAIEKAGGAVASLESGAIAAKIGDAWKQRESNLAKRKDPVTGVSEFPNVLEAPVEPETADPVALARLAKDRLAATRARDGHAADAAVAGLKATPADALAAGVVAAASAGASIGAIAAALGDGAKASVSALRKHRTAERFEALRDAADAHKARTGVAPKIFLANLGSIAKHTARATFAKNFFEVAGVEAITNEGFGDAQSCAAAFKASGAEIAILCSADPVYEEMVAAVAPALKQAGCRFLFLAGHPGDKRDAYAAAGVDDFIFLGCDLLAITRSTLTRLGVTA